MSSAVCFDFNQSKILSSGNGLTPYHETKFQTCQIDHVFRKALSVTG